MARHETRQIMEGGAVVIPKEMRNALGIGDGDQVEFENRAREVLLRRSEASRGSRSERGKEPGKRPSN